MYRPIGINRNNHLAVLQLRPYEPLASRALEWVAYGSNVFNVLVPFYANITTTPGYLADTTTRVTTESFYWANRIVAALADANFGASLPHVERYQEKVGAAARAIIGETDRAIRDGDVDCVAAHEPLEEANRRIAALLRTETDELLDHVLYETSMTSETTRITMETARDSFGSRQRTSAPATSAPAENSATGALVTARYCRTADELMMSSFATVSVSNQTRKAPLAISAKPKTTT